jgi:hypothetical protein
VSNAERTGPKSLSPLERLAVFSVGTFVGMLLHTPYNDSDMLSNARRMDPGGVPRPAPAKLARVSKIAQRVGTLRNQSSG